MALHKREELIVTLAEMLSGRTIEKKTLQEAFTLICNEFSLDFILAYEEEPRHNQLLLTGGCGSFSLPENHVLPKAFWAELYDALLRNPILCIDSQVRLTPGHGQILAMLGAKAAVFFPVIDKFDHIYGLIILGNIEKNIKLDERAKKNLQTALSLLSRNFTVRSYHNRLQFAQSALEGILDNTGIDIYVNDFYNHDILYVNESMAMPYGGKQQFTDRKCWQVLFPGQTGPCGFCPQKKLIDEEGNPTKVYTWDYERAFDGSWFRVFSAAFRWADGRLAHVVSSADITDNKHNEALIRYMANYDALTNLPNRRMLVADCERRINQASEKQAYLLFFDIDGFKNINDSLGHDAGDEFLVKLGAFFTGIPLLKGAIYRNGGDEFVAMLGEDISEDNVRDLARFIHSRFGKPWELKSGTVLCNISIGVAHYPKDGFTAEELIRRADRAMYLVKKDGGGGICFAK